MAAQAIAADTIARASEATRDEKPAAVGDSVGAIVSFGASLSILLPSRYSPIAPPAHSAATPKLTP